MVHQQTQIRYTYASRSRLEKWKTIFRVTSKFLLVDCKEINFSKNRGGRNSQLSHYKAPVSQGHMYLYIKKSYSYCNLPQNTMFSTKGSVITN